MSVLPKTNVRLSARTVATIETQRQRQRRRHQHHHHQQPPRHATTAGAVPYHQDRRWQPRLGPREKGHGRPRVEQAEHEPGDSANATSDHCKKATRPVDRGGHDADEALQDGDHAALALFLRAADRTDMEFPFGELHKPKGRGGGFMEHVRGVHKSTHPLDRVKGERCAAHTAASVDVCRK